MSDIKTENAVVDMIRERGKVGRKKYGVGMDRNDLTVAEWCQHAQEEMLDGAQYLERVKGAAELLERARDMINTLKDEYIEACEWCEDYDRQFGGGK